MRFRADKIWIFQTFHQNKMEDNLKNQAKQQLERLVSQLADLEDSKDEFLVEEYEEMRQDTLEQLQEFESSLQKLNCGEVTLEFTTKAILNETFKTPEIIKMFLSKKSDGLRQKLTELERDWRIGKIAESLFEEQKIEILGALLKLSMDHLTSEEKSFLAAKANQSMKKLMSIDSDPDGVINDASKVMSLLNK